MAFEVTLFEQTALFVYALVLGMIIGAVYDVFRISRIMLTGVGIGSNKTVSYRLESIICKIKRNSAGVIKSKKSGFRERAAFVLIFIQDILFFLIVAAVFTVFLFQVNFGQSRLYVYLSSVLGFAVYYNTIGRISAGVSGFAVSLIRLIGAVIYYKAVRPSFAFVTKAVTVPADILMRKRIVSYSQWESARLSEMSSFGFGFTKINVSKKGEGHENKRKTVKRVC